MQIREEETPEKQRKELLYHEAKFRAETLKAAHGMGHRVCHFISSTSIYLSSTLFFSGRRRDSSDCFWVKRTFPSENQEKKSFAFADNFQNNVTHWRLDCHSMNKRLQKKQALVLKREPNSNLRMKIFNYN